VVSKLPTVTVASPKRDLADWGYWAFALLLVVVGFLQVALMRGTLKAVQRQAGIMEDNIKLIINKERMRISVEVFPLQLPLAKDGAEFEECLINYRVTFDGSTLAFITGSGEVGTITDSAEPPYREILYRPHSLTGNDY